MIEPKLEYSGPKFFDDDVKYTLLLIFGVIIFIGGLSIALITIFKPEESIKKSFDYDLIYTPSQPVIKLCIEGYLYYKVEDQLIVAIQSSNQDHKTCDLGKAKPLKLD